MATKTEIIHTYLCDLCGGEHEKDDLERLYGKQGRTISDDDPTRFDICSQCQDKPVREVISLLEQRRQADPQRWAMF